MSTNLFDHFSKIPAVRRSFATGEHLFHCGDNVSLVYWIAEGAAHLMRFTSSGAPIVMQRATRGCLFAEASIFADRYHCDGISAERVSAFAYRRADVAAALVEKPGFAGELARHVALELMRMRTRSEVASFRTVEERLDAWLSLNDGQLPPRGKRRSLADELRVSPEALYREFARRQESSAGA